MEETRAEKKKKKGSSSESGRKETDFVYTKQRCRARTHKLETRVTAETIKDEWKTCRSARFTFTNDGALERMLQRSSPPPLGIFLPFPGVPFARFQLDSSLSFSLFELLPLAVRGLASCASLRSCHIFFSFRRGPIPSSSDAAAPVSTHLPARTHARTGTLPRRNMPHGQRISAAVGGKVQD